MVVAFKIQDSDQKRPRKIYVANAGIVVLKAPITTAADDKICGIVPNFRKI